jgi:hypothetical protein
VTVSAQPTPAPEPAKPDSVGFAMMAGLGIVVFAISCIALYRGTIYRDPTQVWDGQIIIPPKVITASFVIGAVVLVGFVAVLIRNAIVGMKHVHSTYDVKYLVSGDASGPKIDYQDHEGGHTIKLARLPWSQSVRMQRGDDLWISVGSLNPANTITVTITIDGKPYLNRTVTGKTNFSPISTTLTGIGD